MKWLVFSDSHGWVDGMGGAGAAAEPDRVLHLGDVVGDGAGLAERFPGLRVEQVRGNCDGWGCDIPEERELFFRGTRVWMLHGHAYRVKLGTELLLDEARTRGAGAVLFGHTHQPLCSREGSLWVLNPGTAKSTYGVLEDRDGGLYCRTALMR